MKGTDDIREQIKDNKITLTKFAEVREQRDATDELKWTPSINADHIGVSVSNGVVTLTGYLASN